MQIEEAHAGDRRRQNATADAEHDRVNEPSNEAQPEACVSGHKRLARFEHGAADNVSRRGGHSRSIADGGNRTARRLRRDARRPAWLRLAADAAEWGSFSNVCAAF